MSLTQKTAEMARYLDRVDIDHMAKNFPRLVTLSYNLDPRGCLVRNTIPDANPY